MLDIGIIDFIKYSITNNHITKLSWFVSMFTLVKKDYENEFIIIKDNVVTFKMDEDIIYKKGYKEPLLKYNDKLEIDPSFKVNIKTKTPTTIGRLYMNYLIGTKCLNNKIPYIDNSFTLKDIEDFISVQLEDGSEKAITIDEYKMFLDMRLFIDTLTNYGTLGITEKSLLPAPGMREFKNKTIKEYVDKYGKDGLKDPALFKELEQKIIDYDVAYLKGDKSYGKIITKKIINTARKRLYGIYGMSSSLTGGSKPLLNNLAEGMDLNKKDEIVMRLNDVRNGSYSRGNETKDSGVLTKALLRATSDIVIDDNDCKTNLYLKTVIHNDKDMLSKYIMVNGKPVLLTKDNIKTYINKEVLLRDELYCKSPTGLCIICGGEKYRGYKDVVPLLSISLGGHFLNAMLAKFHGSTLVISKINPKTFIQ